MDSEVGQRVVAITQGIDARRHTGGRFIYEVGWKGTLTGDNTIKFDNVDNEIRSCNMKNFKTLKEPIQSPFVMPCKFKVNDNVVVHTSSMIVSGFNGRNGVIVGIQGSDDNPYQLCFDGTGSACGFLFNESELTLIKEAKDMNSINIGDKVTLYDHSYSYELLEGVLRNTYDSTCIKPCGCDKSIYEVTAIHLTLPTPKNSVGNNDTIIRRLSDSKVMFVEQRFLRDYVPEPKFTKGDFVAHDNMYFRVAKINYLKKRATYNYGLTRSVTVYESDRVLTLFVEEDNLAEVA